jgi:pimeloyl-ACP methyl ester carboxylesterase
MSTFVLVHGSWHGAWCWDKFVPLLQEAGHRVVTFDLPGHGSDQTPIAGITLRDYTDCLLSVLNNESEKVILVGHSMGGIVISQVAEYCPEKIQKLVYLAAFLPQDGQSLLQLAESRGQEGNAPNAIYISEDHTYLGLSDELVRDCLYGDCSEEDIRQAKAKLTLEPLTPSVTPIQLTEEKYGTVPRVYIETLRDNAVPIALQRDMYTRTPCEQVFTLDSDHSPFLSHPQALASHLLQLT